MSLPSREFSLFHHHHPPLCNTAIMESFRRRDSADCSYRGYSPAAYFSPSRSQFDSSCRTYPTTPRLSHSLFVPASHSAPSLLRNITPPEEKIPVGKEQHAVIKDSKLPYDHIRSITPPQVETPVGEEQLAVMKDLKPSYDQAHECVERFNDWHSGANIRRGSSDLYEKNFSIKMPMKEWIKLSNDLNIFETDQRLESPCKITQDA